MFIFGRLEVVKNVDADILVVLFQLGLSIIRCLSLCRLISISLYPCLYKAGPACIIPPSSHFHTRQLLNLGSNCIIITSLIFHRHVSHFVVVEVEGIGEVEQSPEPLLFKMLRSVASSSGKKNAGVYVNVFKNM